MLFIEAINSLIMALIFGGVVFLVLKATSSDKESREVRENQIVIVSGDLVKNTYRDTFSFVTEYRLVEVPQDKKTPIVTFKRFFDGNEDIQIGATSGRAEIEHFGRYKIALLGEALKDIKGQLVDKNV